MKKIIGMALIVVAILAVVGCSPQNNAQVEVSDILDGIKEQVATDLKAAGVSEDQLADGNLPGYQEIDILTDEEDSLPKLFTKDNIAEGYILQHIVDQNANLIIVLKAKDEDKVEALKEELDKVKEQQVTTYQTNLPEQYNKVEANIIKTNGSYLLYVTYDDSEKIEDIFDNAFQVAE